MGDLEISISKNKRNDKRNSVISTWILKRFPGREGSDKKGGAGT